MSLSVLASFVFFNNYYNSFSVNKMFSWVYVKFTSNLPAHNFLFCLHYGVFKLMYLWVFYLWKSWLYLFRSFLSNCSYAILGTKRWYLMPAKRHFELSWYVLASWSLDRALSPFCLTFSIKLTFPASRVPQKSPRSCIYGLGKGCAYTTMTASIWTQKLTRSLILYVAYRPGVKFNVHWFLP